MTDRTTLPYRLGLHSDPYCSCGTCIGKMMGRIAELEAAMRQVRDMKSSPIGDTGFCSGPAGLLAACQRIARKALKGEQ